MEANAISLISQWVTLLRLSPAFPLRKTKLGGASFPAGVRKGEIQQAGQMRGGGSQADKVNLLTFSRKSRKMVLGENNGDSQGSRYSGSYPKTVLLLCTLATLRETRNHSTKQKPSRRSGRGSVRKPSQDSP